MSDTQGVRGILEETDGGGERTGSVPHPENDSDSTKSKERRPSHIRKSRKDSTTKVLRVRRHPDDPIDDGRDEGAQKELWKRVANDPPALPDPPLHRRIPPPAPLPSESQVSEPLPATWSDDKPKLRRVEEAVGIVGLAVLVAAMLVAMWLRMTGG